MPKTKKIPQRTCLGCRTVRAKREMARLVRTPAGEVLLDPTGKKAGRGTYICPTQACLDGAFAGNRLEKALEVEISQEQKQSLRDALARLMS